MPQKGTELTDGFITSNGRMTQSVIHENNGTDYIDALSGHVSDKEPLFKRLKKLFGKKKNREK